jgi:hypothetical protein
MIEQLINILKIPERCLVKKKLTKAFFKRNFDLTLSEKSLLDDYSIVVAMEWVASISPHNSNIPNIDIENRTFEEIQVIALQTSVESFDRFKIRLIDLVQKYIPYHVLMIIHDDERFIINVCDKEINANDPNKRIVEGKYTTENISMSSLSANQATFIDNLEFARLNKTNLFSLFQSFIQIIVALQASDIKGDFTTQNQYRTAQDVNNLSQINQLKKEVEKLIKMAQKEPQMNNRVKINQQIQLKRNQINTFENSIRK